MNKTDFNPFKKTKHKPYELGGIGFTIIFFWLLGDEKLLYLQNFSLVDLYNLLFTIVIVFFTWILFKWQVWLLLPFKKKYTLVSYYLIQMVVTGFAMMLFIFISNWIYIYLIWQKSFEDNYFLTVIFPTVAIFSIIWNLIELCFFLYTNSSLDIPLTVNTLQEKNFDYKEEKYIWVKTEKAHLKIELKEVAFIILQEGLVWLVLFNAKKYLLDKNLNQLEDFLPNSSFFRATRQLILSKQAILKIEDEPNQKIKVQYLGINGFPNSSIVSRYKASAFKKFSLSAVH